MSQTAGAWAQLRSLPRAVWWLAGATLINRCGAMVFPFLVLYFHRSLSMSLAESTAISSFFGLGSLLASPLGGWLADRIDATRVLRVSLAGGGLVMLAFPWIRGAQALTIATFLMALFTDLSRPSVMTALARLGGERSREAFSLNYFAINLGMSVGPTLGGYLAEVDYRWLFWVDGTTSCCAAALLVWSGISCPHQEPGQTPGDWNLGAPAWALYLVGLPCMWAFSTFWTASPVYGVESLGLRESQCGLIWLLNTLLIVATTIHLNHWTRSLSPARGLVCASGLFGLCYLLMLALPNIVGLVAGLLALTLGEMLLFPNLTTHLQQVVPAHKIGRAMGLNAIVMSCSMTLAAPTVGYFFTQQTPQRLWIALAIAAFVAAGGFALLPTRRGG